MYIFAHVPRIMSDIDNFYKWEDRDVEDIILDRAVKERFSKEWHLSWGVNEVRDWIVTIMAATFM